MVGNFAMLIRIISLVVVLLCSAPSFGGEQWRLVSHVKQPVMFAQGSLQYYKNPLNIEIKDTADDSNPVSLLSKYYWLLVNQKIASVEKLYTNKDGSRAKFHEAIESKKLNLAGYQNVRSVKILERFQWGPFHYFSLRLNSNSGQELTWSETVVCEKYCAMVFDLLSTDETANLVDFARASYWESTDINGNLTGRLTPSNEMLSFSLYPSKAKLFSGRKEPIQVFLDLKRYEKPLLVSREECLDEAFGEAKKPKSLVVAEFCNLMKAAKLQNLEDESSLKPIYKKYWGVDEPTPVPVNVQKDLTIHRVYYSSQAFLGLFSHIDAVEILGDFSNSRTRFVIYRPILPRTESEGDNAEGESGGAKSAQMPFQLMTMNLRNIKKEPELTLSGNGESVYELFFNEYFANALQAKLQEG